MKRIENGKTAPDSTFSPMAACNATGRAVSSKSPPNVFSIIEQGDGDGKSPSSEGTELDGQSHEANTEDPSM